MHTLTSDNPLQVALKVEGPLVEGAGGHCHRSAHGDLAASGAGRCRRAGTPPPRPLRPLGPWVERAPPMGWRGGEKSAAGIGQSGRAGAGLP